MLTGNVSSDDSEESKLWEGDFLQEQTVGLQFLARFNVKMLILPLVKTIITRSGHSLASSGRLSRGWVFGCDISFAQDSYSCCHQVGGLSSCCSLPFIRLAIRYLGLVYHGNWIGACQRTEFSQANGT